MYPPPIAEPKSENSQDTKRRKTSPWLIIMNLVCCFLMEIGEQYARRTVRLPSRAEKITYRPNSGSSEAV